LRQTERVNCQFRRNFASILRCHVIFSVLWRRQVDMERSRAYIHLYFVESQHRKIGKKIKNITHYYISTLLLLHITLDYLKPRNYCYLLLCLLPFFWAKKKMYKQ